MTNRRDAAIGTNRTTVAKVIRSSAVSTIVSTLAALFVLPRVLHGVNVTRYGEWATLAAVLAVGLGFLTVRRNEDYRSELAIWADAAAKRPDNPRAHNNLGITLRRAGKVQEAIGQYEQALRIKPDFTQAQNALARLQARQ